MFIKKLGNYNTSSILKFPSYAKIKNKDNKFQGINNELTSENTQNIKTKDNRVSLSIHTRIRK